MNYPLDLLKETKSVQLTIYKGFVAIPSLLSVKNISKLLHITILATSKLQKMSKIILTIYLKNDKINNVILFFRRTNK